jgi:pimeloyl-ACP methyl ester carboxylesterase
VNRIHQESIVLPSGRFALLRAGQGQRLLILLHGFPDHPPSFEPLIALLAAGGYTVVVPWLRGYAPSTLDGPYDIGRIAQDVLELASALGHERFSLVGHEDPALAGHIRRRGAPALVAQAKGSSRVARVPVRSLRRAIVSLPP